MYDTARACCSLHAPRDSTSFTKLRHKYRFGSDGSCTAVLEVVFFANPSQFAQYINQGITDVDQLMLFIIHAQAYGKSSHKPKASTCRVILPLPPILQLFDSLLSAWILQLPMVLWEASTSCTQCLDIATTCHIGQGKSWTLTVKDALSRQISKGLMKAAICAGALPSLLIAVRTQPRHWLIYRASCTYLFLLRWSALLGSVLGPLEA